MSFWVLLTVEALGPIRPQFDRAWGFGLGV